MEHWTTAGFRRRLEALKKEYPIDARVGNRKCLGVKIRYFSSDGCIGRRAVVVLECDQGHVCEVHLHDWEFEHKGRPEQRDCMVCSNRKFQVSCIIDENIRAEERRKASRALASLPRPKKPPTRMIIEADE